MTSPGGGGPIETAYILIKPQVSTAFADDIRKQILPILKNLNIEAEKAFNSAGAASRDAAKGVSSVTRSLNSAAKAADKYAHAAGAASSASAGLGRASASANSALRGTVGATDAAGRGANRAGTSFNFLTRALIIGGVYEAGKALKDLAGFGIQAAAQLEQTKIAFTGLLGSVGASDAFTKKLQTFANATPFDFENVALASQRLLSLGQTGDQAIATLTTVGNAAAAVGADQSSINRVVLALAQIQAKGKLSAEEINQVAEALPNLNRGAVVQNLADTFGKTTQQIQKLQQQGLIPAQAGIDAILKSLQNVPGAMGAMDRQAQTLSGRFSTFKDTIKANFSNALQDSLPILGDSLTKLTDTVSTQLASFGPALSQTLVTLTPFVEGLVNTIGPILTGLISSIAPILAQIAPALAPIGAAVTTAFAAIGPALEPLAAIFAQLLVAMAPVGAQLGVTLANALIAVTPLIISFSEVLIPMLNYLAAHPTLLGDLAIGATALFVAFKAYTVIERATAALKLLGIVTFAQTVAQEGLNVAMRANPIGIIITAISFLVGGFILLYRHSETVRKGFGDLRDFGVKAVKFMVDAIIDYFTLFIRIAAAAFGWVPGIGGKLKAAAEGVDKFKDMVNSSIDKITKNVDINVTTHVYTVAELKQNTKSAARDARVQKGLKAIAPGGKINELTPEERAGVEADVDKAIAAEEAAAKRVPKEKPILKQAPKLLDSTKDAAKAAADKIKTAMTAMADSVKSKVKVIEDWLSKFRKSFEEIIGKIKSFTEITALSQDAASATAGGILNTLETRVKAIRLMTNNLLLLQKKGLDKGVLDQLAKAGPEQRGFVSALVQASPDQIRALNAAEKQSRGLADTLAKQATDREFGKGALAKNLAALAEQNKRLAAIEKVLKSSPTQIAAAFAAYNKSQKVTVTTAKRTTVR